MDEHDYDDLPLRQKRGQRRSEGIDRRAERLQAPVAEPVAGETTNEASDAALPGEALVVAISRGQCEVEMNGEIAICHLPKALALVQKSDLAVGDRLRVARRPGGELVVAQVLPRSSRLSRPDPLLAHRERVLAANLDLAVVVTALRKPPLATGLLDRFLVALAHGGVPAAIVVNKYDLVEETATGALADAGGASAPAATNDPELARLAPYRALRFPFLFCSTRTGRGIEELRALLAGKTVVFVGHSGVGKSSLLSALSPELDVRVGEVSTMNARGRHTTTRARIYRLANETRIIDTPGIREFGLWKLSREELSLYFEEFEPLSPHCRFNDCSHSHEPLCAVREAAATGALDANRYETYLRILASLSEER
ncbi:MAG: ribosome small subunit-dependent GTPase A [Thermoanaerobaculia bacterium]